MSKFTRGLKISQTIQVIALGRFIAIKFVTFTKQWKCPGMGLRKPWSKLLLLTPVNILLGWPT